LKPQSFTLRVKYSGFFKLATLPFFPMPNMHKSWHCTARVLGSWLSQPSPVTNFLLSKRS